MKCVWMLGQTNATKAYKRYWKWFNGPQHTILTNKRAAEICPTLASFSRIRKLFIVHTYKSHFHESDSKQIIRMQRCWHRIETHAMQNKAMHNHRWWHCNHNMFTSTVSSSCIRFGRVFLVVSSFNHAHFSATVAVWFQRSLKWCGQKIGCFLMTLE